MKLKAISLVLAISGSLAAMDGTATMSAFIEYAKSKGYSAAKLAGDQTILNRLLQDFFVEKPEIKKIESLGQGQLSICRSADKQGIAISFNTFLIQTTSDSTILAWNFDPNECGPLMGGAKPGVIYKVYQALSNALQASEMVH